MKKEQSLLTADEKREKRFQKWLNPENITFNNPEAGEMYKKRVQRFIDAITLKEPDRVPVSASAGHVPARYSGYTIKEVMYDAEKMEKAWRKYMRDFEHDCLPGAALVRCGKAMDILNPRMHKWPGHGLDDDLSVQFVDDEYMKEDEWDAFLNDPSDFNMRIYLPRIYGAAESLRNLPPLKNFGGLGGSLDLFADPEIRDALEAMRKASKLQTEWYMTAGKLKEEGVASGIPMFSGGFVPGGCPMDNIGAGLRGTKGLIRDMFKQPDKLIAYMEKTVPESIENAVRAADMTGNPVIFLPLHRGADGWMSEKQFLTFYWPYLKAVVLGQVEEGLVPVLFAEGGYETRLDIIKELPAGKVIWHFDQTDIAKAKKALGGRACIMGNLPASMLATATSEEVKANCKKLIEIAGRDGGYILAPGATTDQAKVENLQVMLEASKEYGVYRQ